MKFIYLILFSLIPLYNFALVKDSLELKTSIPHKAPSLFVSLELTSHYIWRGLEYGNSPTSFGKFIYTTKHFDAYLEGIYGLNDSHSEVDLGVGLSYKWIYFGLSDYYYPSSVGKKDKYFRLNNKTTGHYIEAYSIITPKCLPFQLTLSSYVFGADKKGNGKQAFSSYAELTYIQNLKNNTNLELTIGANLNKGFYTEYIDGISITNIALKYNTNFKFGSFLLPVSASYVVNPYKNKSFFIITVYFTSKL